MPQHSCGGQRTKVGCHFSYAMRWDLGIKLRSSSPCKKYLHSLNHLARLNTKSGTDTAQCCHPSKQVKGCRNLSESPVQSSMEYTHIHTFLKRTHVKWLGLGGAYFDHLVKCCTVLCGSPTTAVCCRGFVGDALSLHRQSVVHQYSTESGPR